MSTIPVLGRRSDVVTYLRHLELMGSEFSEERKNIIKPTGLVISKIVYGIIGKNSYKEIHPRKRSF